MQYTYNEFVEIMENKQIVIYGSGSMAGRLYSALCRRHLEKNVLCCAVSILDESCIVNKFVKNLELLSAKEAICKYPYGFFCIAVHESSRDEIIHVLQQGGICDKDYTWPIPFLRELMLSKPIKENIFISPGDIVRECSNLCLACRWLALRQYYGLCDVGYGLYIRSLMIYSTRKTAERRLEAFKALLSAWDERGYDSSSVCKVDEKLNILDGMHRLCAALWHEEKELICDMYRYDGSYEDFERPFYQNAEILQRNGFLKDEIILVEKAMDELKRKAIG